METDQPTYQITTSWIGEEILEIVIAGDHSRVNAVKIAHEVVELVDRQQPKLVLIDNRPLKGRLGIVDTYYHVRAYPKRLHRPDKTALLDYEHQREYYSFYVDTSFNVGVSLRFFTDRDGALAWLRS